MQEVSSDCVYTSPFLDTDHLKMALRARKLCGAFEKRAPGPCKSAQTLLAPSVPETTCFITNSGTIILFTNTTLKRLGFEKTAIEKQ